MDRVGLANVADVSVLAGTPYVPHRLPTENPISTAGLATISRKFTGLAHHAIDEACGPAKDLKSNMDEASDETVYAIDICGSFRVMSPDGQRLDVSSKKARCILAILALSPNMERQRGWFMDRLWGSREKFQAQSSLRHELSFLRKLFGPAETSPIEILRDCVRLIPDRVCIDALEGAVDGELLEGIDIAGEDGFEDWLRTARSATMQTASLNPIVNRLSGAIAPCHAIKIGLLNVETAPNDLCAANTGNILLSKITHFFLELGGFEVIDLRAAERGATQYIAPDVYLQCFAQSNDMRVEISLSLLRSSDKAILWSQVRHISVNEQGNIKDWNLANEVSDQILAKIASQPHLFSSAPHIAAVSAIQGIDSMFSLSARNLDLADQCFAAASEMYDSSSFLAWRAYLSAHWMEEQNNKKREDILARTYEYAERALSMDPYNGLTLSLLSHVFAFVFRDFDRASELIERAHSVQSQHVMTYDAKALLQLYKGDLVAARKSAMQAAMLGRFLPHRYAFVTTLCMIDTLNGDFRSGIRNGNLALSLQPSNTGNFYPPTLRYLGACYAQMGQIDSARNTFSQLARVEPHLSSAIIGTQEYPVPSNTAAHLIGDSLSLCGY